MTLAERILALREQKKLSQGDLAEAIGVSRQSVSKWETGASTPDLDKLLAMSELFGVSLDALVKGSPEELAPLPPEAPSTAPAAPQSTGMQPRQVVGLVFLSVGLFGSLLCLLLNGAGLLLFTLPMALAGALCLLIRRHVVLWLGWIFFLLIALGGSTIFGFRFRPFLLLLHPEVFFSYTISGLISCLLFLWLGLLLYFTVRCLRKGKRGG